MKGCRREWVYQNIRAKADSINIPAGLDYTPNGSDEPHSPEIEKLFGGMYDRTVKIKVEPDFTSLSTPSTPDGSTASSSPLINKAGSGNSPGPSTPSNNVSSGQINNQGQGADLRFDHDDVKSDDILHPDDSSNTDELMDASNGSSHKCLVEEILHETSAAFHFDSNESNQLNEGHHLQWEDIKVCVCMYEVNCMYIISSVATKLF